MRILHIITSLHTGGAEHLMIDLLPRLREHGHDVELLLFDGTRTPFFRQLEEQGIKIHSLSEGQRAQHNPFLVFALHRWMKSFDIVHTHNTPCQMLAAAASYGTRCRLFTTEHNTDNRRRGKWYWKPIDRWMYRRYETVVCCSRETESSLRASLSIISEHNRPKITTISNGIDTRRFAQAGATRREPDGKVRIIMVAAFREQKNHDVLIKSMKLLPVNYELWLVGQGDTMDANRRLVESLGLEKRVSFWGVRMDVPELLQQSDIIALATHHEGLSLSSLEGMASGRPFLGSNVSGLRDIVCGAGVLVDNTPEAWAEAIRRIATDKDEYRHVAELCQRRAAEYDVSVMADAYAAVYQKK